MSGICGIYRRDRRPVGEEELGAMLQRLRHRGPDAESVWRQDAVALGHCMLWITPESLHEHLPHPDRTGDLVITADARIDNRQDLLDILYPGAVPKEVTDSDLILAAYDKWGEECVSHLLGDFAFVIWDRRRHSMFCASDPMGVKSMFYYLSDRLFIFASEIKSLFAVPDVPQRLNEVHVAEYLASLFEDATATFYEGILRLPGAHAMSVGPLKTSVHKYWKLDSTREIRYKSSDEYVDAFRDLFSEAVRCRTRSAYPIGSALSGGLDSSSIACLARNLHSPETGDIHTFSLIFPGLPAKDLRVIDERSQMQAVLDTGGFVPHFIEADKLSPMGQVDRVHFHLDQANYAPNLYLHWAMYDEARKHGVRVFLDGFDGDGAVSHGFERLTALAQTLQWRTLKREVQLLARHHLAGVSPRRIVKQFCILPLTPRWLHLAWQFLHGRRREVSGQNVFLSEPFKRRTRIVERAHAMLRPQNAWSLTVSPRERHRRGMAQALYGATLELADKASAAFTLEARYPFFDRRVLEFCLALPVEQKLGFGWNRWTLRQAMTGILPHEIQWRPRKGDLSPNFHRGLLDFERETLEAVALRGSPSLQPYVDSRRIGAAYREYEKTRENNQGESIQLFAAANLALWLRTAGFSSQ